MQISNSSDFIGGWFIGNFTPTLNKCDEFEVAIKYYNQGDKEWRHLHKLAIEYTVIAKGKVKMNGIIINEGQIVKIDKNESTDFEVLEPTITFVIKTPSVNNDKYILDNE